MTWSAWLLLATVWTVIGVFTVRFFIGVLRKTEADGNDPDQD